MVSQKAPFVRAVRRAPGNAAAWQAERAYGKQGAMKKSSYAYLILSVSAACSSEASVPPADTIAEVTIDTSAPVTTIDKRYLSVAVDTAQVVGGEWWSSSGEMELMGQERVPVYDFSRPRLRALAAALAPAFLRIGGSDADRIYYDMSAEPLQEAPDGYNFVLTAKQLDGVFEFADTLGYDVAFTLSSGLGPDVRDETGAWIPDMTEDLVSYVASKDYAVSLWELGNEWNQHFVDLGDGFEAEQVIADFATARALLDEYFDDFLFGGISSSYWPSVGEIAPLYPDFISMGGADSVDVITWHYYPQQSQRGPVATDPWAPGLLLDPKRLDIALKWYDDIADHRDEHAPEIPIWLGETGHAQYGGQPGSSDRFEGTFWWLDQLGALAGRGQPITVRQTLSGSNYGLIDDVTLDPRPDYWASVLWRRLMGERVLDVSRTAADDYVRVYAHCTQGPPGTVAVLVINLLEDETVRMKLNGITSKRQEIYLLTSDALDSKDIMLNGAVLRDDNGVLPPLEPDVMDGGPLDIPPRAMAFILYPFENAPACQ
jgi:heparanase 1